MTRPTRRAQRTQRAGAARAATWFLMLVPSAALAAAALSSCSVVHHGSTTGSPAGTTGSGGSAGTGGMTGTGGTALSGRALFESTVLDGIMKECGTCHQLGGAADVPFLAAPDVYVSITTWPGIIVSTPDLSTVLTHPSLPSHGGGQAPDMSKGLRAKVKPWLEYEAVHLPMPDAGARPFIPPFKPLLQGAFNAVYLDPLGKMGEFQNASVTFNAQELGSPPSLLRLSNLQVHPVAGKDVHLVHPLFTVYPAAGGELPDTADSFSGFDATFDIAGDPTFGTGEIILSNWVKDARLGIAFESAQIITMGGSTATCTHLAKFQAEVLPLLTGMVVPCSTCHGGIGTDAGVNIQAQQQMDLSNLAAMPPDEACSQMRARITPGDPGKSEILIVTDPTQGAVHLFKFAGNKTHYNNFRTAVTPWILAE